MDKKQCSPEKTIALLNVRAEDNGQGQINTVCCNEDVVKKVKITKEPAVASKRRISTGTTSWTWFLNLYRNCPGHHGPAAGFR